jgi:hypothetical protein
MKECVHAMAARVDQDDHADDDQADGAPRR